jgi:hypothetical protein
MIMTKDLGDRITTLFRGGCSAEELVVTAPRRKESNLDVSHVSQTEPYFEVRS